MSANGDTATLRVLSAEPELIRVAVLGGRTQLDVALPLDVPVSAFIPDLARLIRSRDVEHDEDPATKEQRRTFWVLSRFESDEEVAPNHTLRQAGVSGGQRLRLTPQRALSPPTLYDDVVDAAARLNKASYAAWGAQAARFTAIAGVHLIVMALLLLIVQPGDTAQRPVLAGLAGAVVIALLTVAAVAHRTFGLDGVAAGIGWATIPLTAVIAWVFLLPLHVYGLAAVCGVVVIVNVVSYRIVAAGHWAYLATSVLAGLVGVAVLCHGLGVTLNVVCVTLAVLAVLLCATVPRLTSRLGRVESAPVDSVAAHDDELGFDNPFAPAGEPDPDRTAASIDTLPTAEAVWARVRYAAVTRSALSTGLSTTVAVAVAVLLLDGDVVPWSVFAFALTCTAVLGLRSRLSGAWFERAALAVPAAASLVATCVLAQRGTAPIPMTAFGVLLVVAVIAVIAVIAGSLDRDGSSHRVAALLSYLDYVALAAVLPTALWALGIYGRLPT